MTTTWPGALGFAGIAAILMVVVGVFDANNDTPAPGRAVAQHAVDALTAHDAAAVTSLLCSPDPASQRIASAQLPITRSWLADDGLSYAGSTRRDIVYRIEGVPDVRGVGVSVMMDSAGNWCVLGMDLNPTGRY